MMEERNDGALLFLYSKARRALDDLTDALEESGYTDRAKRAEEIEAELYHEKQLLLKSIREQGEAAGRKR